MKKRWTAFFLAFLLGLGLTACGKTPGPDTNTDAPPSAAEDIRQQTSAPFSADYWTAVRHESYAIPCCREVYYNLYRRFFWLLSKERD